ncbi:ABC transporter permease [Epilithonimonas mollis]|uniref:Lipoprotein-releasing system permease protein n=1 Tax=Epilithonimonas mollis TaxID=216903 RepID=A0A1M6MX38_9FLAO|nr:FtsX-like permease family protein [Epilithonimonas mollis]SHJ88037.1 lipoprotein-releasing system permease protein [Epilithonimonas mollis]
MNINRKISWIYLSSKVKQLFVAVLSVTFGISMYIFMNSFMSGVNSAQTQISFTSMSHIRIYNDLPSDVNNILQPTKKDDGIVIVNNARNIRYTEGIKNTEPIKESVAKLEEIEAITEQLNQNIFIRNGVTKINASLSGVDVENEDHLFHTSDYMRQGHFFDLEKRSDGIILGFKLAQNLGVGMDDNITVLTSDGITRIFKIIGIMETGAASVDKTRAIISIRSARQLFSKNSSFATDILVNIDDYNNSKEISRKIAAMTKYKVEAWQDGNAQLDSANVLRNILAVAVSSTILIVAGFGIYNIMNMTVNEKIKEIAILKAMGFNGADIVEIFLTQSIIIGLIGGFTGLGFGYFVSKVVDQIPFKIGSMTTLPIDYSPADYVLALLFGLMITAIAGYLPARNASKIDPVAILRG